MTHTQVIVYTGVFCGLVGLRCVWLCRGWGKHLHNEEEEEEEEAEGEYVGGCKQYLAGGASCLASNGILRFMDKPRPLPRDDSLLSSLLLSFLSVFNS